MDISLGKGEHDLQLVAGLKQHYKKEELAGIKADALIESLDFERNKRSFIQYKTIDVEKHSKAKTSLERAKEFTKEMEKLLI